MRIIYRYCDIATVSGAVFSCGVSTIIYAVGKNGKPARFLIRIVVGDLKRLQCVFFENTPKNADAFFHMNDFVVLRIKKCERKHTRQGVSEHTPTTNYKNNGGVKRTWLV